MICYWRFISLVYFASILGVHATTNLRPTPDEQYKQEINRIYQETTIPQNQLIDRITRFSALFLGKPYQLTALGEGPRGHYDQSPLYRTDAFDCETYVDTVLALALGNSTDSFENYIKRIRYRHGKVSYIYRNHFTCVDWNKNNQQQGFLKDITTSIHDDNNQPIIQLAKAFIDKKAWYHHANLNRIHLPEATELEKTHRLMELQQEGDKQKNSFSIVPYIPIAALFDTRGKPNLSIFKQIPNGSIIEIIRPNWDLTDVIGTHLNISHLGFAIWNGDTLFYRNASSLTGGVYEQPLIPYLKSCMKSPTIKGINVWIVMPTPSTNISERKNVPH